MTSVPLKFWPDNLSSLAWLGIVISLLLGSFLNEYDVFNYNWHIIITYIIMICLGIFILDQIILGPLYYLLCDRTR